MNLYEIRFHPQVIQHIKRKKINNATALKTFISERLKAVNNGDLYFWGISKIDNSKLIGTICLWNFNETKTIAEIGYELHPDFHGKGLMSEAMKSVLNFGFSTLNFVSIEAFTSKHNEPSKSLLNKFGFSLEPNRKDEGFPNNIIYTKHND